MFPNDERTTKIWIHELTFWHSIIVLSARKKTNCHLFRFFGFFIPKDF